MIELFTQFIKRILFNASFCDTRPQVEYRKLLLVNVRYFSRETDESNNFTVCYIHIILVLCLRWAMMNKCVRVKSGRPFLQYVMCKRNLIKTCVVARKSHAFYLQYLSKAFQNRMRELIQIDKYCGIICLKFITSIFIV